MSCNPCCCLKLKDAAITIGIWSTIYSIMQLGIFGWQMAAIKYEKDRAANTLLPNYNTYGRYDIPTYYESYWQSPEERYYTWLFVIQILCLIAAFFLLFASIMMIYGVHTWSRYLLVPWMVTMCASILTSLAYCIMWWAGDVRDYWLMLTIVEMFGVFLNTYCFVVICVFHRRMLAELEYYARRRKYDRFSSQRPPHHPKISPPHTIELDSDDLGGDEFGQPKQLPPTSMQRSFRRPAAGQFPYQQQQQSPQQPMPATAGRFYHPSSPNGYHRRAADGGPPIGGGGAQQAMYPEGMARREFYHEQRTPMERFQQEAIIPPPPPPEPPFKTSRDFMAEQRPRSSMEQRTYPSQYDEFRTTSRQRKAKCRQCGRAHGNDGGGMIGGSSGSRQRHHHRHWCHHCADHCHCHDRSRPRKYSCSSITSFTNGNNSSDEEKHKRRGKSKRRRRKTGPGRWSEQEAPTGEEGSELSGEIQSEHNYGNVSMVEDSRQRQTPTLFRRKQQPVTERGRGQRSGEEREWPMAGGGGTLLSRSSSQPFLPPQGISIPQHIIIPPVARRVDASGTLDSQTERQYRINSEITISYDPVTGQQQQQQNQQSNNIQSPPPTHHSQPAAIATTPSTTQRNVPPTIPPRRGILVDQFHRPLVPSSSAFGSLRERPQQQQQQSMSITSNV